MVPAAKLDIYAGSYEGFKNIQVPSHSSETEVENLQLRFNRDQCSAAFLRHSLCDFLKILTSRVRDGVFRLWCEREFIRIEMMSEDRHEQLGIEEGMVVGVQPIALTLVEVDPLNQGDSVID